MIMVLVAIGLAGYVQSIATAAVTSEVTRQISIATRSAQTQMEDLKGFDFATVFAAFNPDPADDPGGAGTAGGSAFAVAGLDALPGDADGLVGEILLPVGPGAPGVLREDMVMPDLGMPRDLNGDGLVDAVDHSGDYQILPVLVRLTWQGQSGTSTLEFKTLLSGF